MSDWSNPCGVAYRWYEDGSFEVEGLDFPSYAEDSAEEKLLQRVWSDWGAYVVEGAKLAAVPQAWVIAVLCAESGGRRQSRSACTAKLCPALWNKGLCADQGGPNQFCAGGLMGFTQGAAKLYGRTVDWYFADDTTEGQQVIDGADFLRRKIVAAGNEVLAGVKAYNGGKPCADTGMAPGPGIVNMYGQGGYVEKIIRLANTFVRMQLPQPKAPPGPEPVRDDDVPLVASSGRPAIQGVAVLLALGAAFALAYRWDETTRHWLPTRRAT